MQIAEVKVKQSHPPVCVYHHNTFLCLAQYNTVMGYRVLVAGTVTWRLRRLLLRMIYVFGHLLGPVSRQISVRTVIGHTHGRVGMRWAL